MVGSRKVYKSTAQNPFSLSQAKKFSDKRVLVEFEPISLFWSLFNEQNEIIIGTRGSGKTILLKMMSYSLLRKFHHKKAKKIINDREFVGIYAPSNLEFLGDFIHQNIPEEKKILYFQYTYNCLLTIAYLNEIQALLLDVCKDDLGRSLQSENIVKVISRVLFPEEALFEMISFSDLVIKITNMYNNIEAESDKLLTDKSVFNKPICNPILATSQVICELLNIAEPTWIICLDEAEFLPLELQKCVNTTFRSFSKKIALKVATLPYKHLTKETLVEGVFADPNGHDFNYRFINLSHNSNDFVSLTNGLCNKRFKSAFPGSKNAVTLEKFLGQYGGDDYIDYYFEEIKKEYNIDRESLDKFICSRLILELSKDKQGELNLEEDMQRIEKPIIDKLAPIFFLREMYEKSKEGARKPGWYAGAKTVRKVADGNPRLYIQIMYELFEYSRKYNLSPKAQHKVIFDFAKDFINSSDGLPDYGPELHDLLDDASKNLFEKTHGQYLTPAGNVFKLSNELALDDKILEAIKTGVQYSRLKIGDDIIVTSEITPETHIALANIVSLYNWIPMRKHTPVVLQAGNKIYKRRNDYDKKISLFNDNNDKPV